MPAKTLVFLGMIVGSIIGGYLPALFGVSLLSYTSIITSTVGGFLGMWVGFKLSQWLN